MPDRIDDVLTTIRTENWLTATDESNRQHGDERRAYFCAQITKALPRFNRKLLDNALSLNVSFDHNPERQKLRRGVRAIMLAEFVVKGTPLQQAPVLKQRLLNLNADSLRRTFLSTFPSIIDPSLDPNRALWAPTNFTDPATFPDWVHTPIGPYRFIVHCLPTDGYENTLRHPTATISSWSAISTSVVDETNSVIYGYYGFVLRVPQSNIIAASSEDQNLLNHLGTALTRNLDYEQKLTVLQRSGLLSQHLADLYAKQGGLRTPLQCIRTNRNGRWNEVIVLGKGYMGPTTVSALFYRVSSNHRYYIPKGGSRSPITDTIENAVRQSAATNHLPIIYIPDSTGKWG